jgi:hypothetical protein
MKKGRVGDESITGTTWVRRLNAYPDSGRD